MAAQTCCPVVELRQNLLRPGRREALIATTAADQPREHPEDPAEG